MPSECFYTQNQTKPNQKRSTRIQRCANDTKTKPKRNQKKEKEIHNKNKKQQQQQNYRTRERKRGKKVLQFFKFIDVSNSELNFIVYIQWFDTLCVLQTELIHTGHCSWRLNCVNESFRNQFSRG